MPSSFITVSAPQCVVALLLLYVFAVKLGRFPIGGYGTAAHLVLPDVTLGILGSGWYSRRIRSSMIEVLRADYIRSARAKGLGRARVVFRHALPNAILPVIAMIGIEIGIFMGGIVVVESVFGWTGIGQLVWQAIQHVDIPIIMTVTLISAYAIILGNLLAVLVAPLIDPRIRFRCSGTNYPGRIERPHENLARFQGICPFVGLARNDAGLPRTPMPKAGWTITITYKDDVVTLDPAIGCDWQKWSMIKSLFDGMMADQFTETALEVWKYDPASMAPALWSDRGRVPLKPLAGTIGNALAEPGLHTVGPPRRVGGNRDIRGLNAGATLYLPVGVAGAFQRG